MKKLIFLVTMLTVVFSATSNSQVVISMAEPSPANPSALLELQSSDSMGLLLPRVKLVDELSSLPLSDSLHSEGMLVYNTSKDTTISPGLYYNDGSQWNKIATTNTQEENLCTCCRLKKEIIIGSDSIANLDSIAVELISNPGTDKSIKIHNILFNYLYSGNTFSSAGAVFEVLFLPTISSSILSFPAFELELGLSQNTSFFISTESCKLISNRAVFIKTKNAPISKYSSATTGTLKVIVEYEIVDLN